MDRKRTMARTKFIQIIFIFFLTFSNNKSVFANSIFLKDDSIKIIRTNKEKVEEDNFKRLKVGDLFPNITIYDTSGKIVLLDSIFKDSKGVIFVNGSYTCPSFRSSVPQINNMVANQIHTYRIYFIYTEEAHPISGSPYGEDQNNNELSLSAGILVDQPDFIEERGYYAKKAMKDFGLKTYVLLDNENNDFFWKVFSGPNGFMIFSSQRKLIRQQNWYSPTDDKKSKKKAKNK